MHRHGIMLEQRVARVREAVRVESFLNVANRLACLVLARHGLLPDADSKDEQIFRERAA